VNESVFNDEWGMGNHTTKKFITQKHKHKCKAMKLYSLHALKKFLTGIYLTIVSARCCFRSKCVVFEEKFGRHSLEVKHTSKKLNEEFDRLH
jgi:hypothetical protein